MPGGTTLGGFALGRFRAKLVEHDLWELLLGEVNRQLEAKHIIITEGRVNINDATAIEAAQSGSGKGKDGEPSKDAEAAGMRKPTAVVATRPHSVSRSAARSTY